VLKNCAMTASTSTGSSNDAAKVHVAGDCEPSYSTLATAAAGPTAIRPPIPASHTAPAPLLGSCAPTNTCPFEIDRIGFSPRVRKERSTLSWP
jgi:hypothetical protein